MYDDDRDALAAEYVLGTLSSDERDQAEALLAIDPGFAEMVRVWERRLGELNVMVEAVEPPAEAWDKIKAEIGGGERATEVESVLPALEEAVTQTPPETAAEAAPSPPMEALPELVSEPVPSVPDETPAEEVDSDSAAIAALASSLVAEGEVPPPGTEAAVLPEPAVAPPSSAPERAAGGERGADVVYLSRKAKRWQGFTGLMTGIAALLAIYIGVDRLAPNLLRQNRQAPPAIATAQPPSSRLVAVLQQEPTAPAFLLTVDPKARTLTVRRMTAAADSGRSYELWLIAGKKSSPQSLGLVGDQEFTTRPLPASLDASAMRSASYAVSLEPAGGSTRGAPTGPVLFTGKMVESVPGSAS